MKSYLSYATQTVWAKKMFREKQTVRLSLQRKPFQKRVPIPRNRGEPITYVLHNNKGEIRGRFYASELIAFKYDEDRHRGRQHVGIAAERLVNKSS